MLDRSAALHQRMTEREYNVRKNALDLLDDMVLGRNGFDLEPGDRANIAIFLLEHLVPEIEEQDGIHLQSLVESQQD